MRVDINSDPPERTPLATEERPPDTSGSVKSPKQAFSPPGSATAPAPAPAAPAPAAPAPATPQGRVSSSPRVVSKEMSAPPPPPDGGSKKGRTASHTWSGPPVSIDLDCLDDGNDPFDNTPVKPYITRQSTAPLLTPTAAGMRTGRFTEASATPAKKKPLNPADDNTRPYVMNIAKPRLVQYFPLYDSEYYSEKYVRVAEWEKMSLEVLLRKLLEPGHNDEQLRKKFLATHSIWISTPELLDLLVQRYNCVAAFGYPPADLDKYRNLLKWQLMQFTEYWLTHFPSDFFEQHSHRMMLFEFIKLPFDEAQMVTDREQFDPELKEFARSLDKVRRNDPDWTSGLYDKRYSTAECGAQMQAPLPPAVRQGGSIVDFHPIELARQLAKSDFDLYYRVRPTEYLDKEPSPHHTMLVYRITNITNWVKNEVLDHAKRANRARVWARWICIAHCSIVLHDFAAAAAIVSALTHPVIARLDHTEMLLPDGCRELMAAMMFLVDLKDDMAVYRARMRERTTGPPGIPFTMPYKAIIERAGSLYPKWDKEGLMNLRHMQVVYDNVRSCMSLRDGTYSIAEEPATQYYIWSCLKTAETYRRRESDVSRALLDASLKWQPQGLQKPQERADPVQEEFLADVIAFRKPTFQPSGPKGPPAVLQTLPRMPCEYHGASRILDDESGAASVRLDEAEIAVAAAEDKDWQTAMLKHGLAPAPTERSISMRKDEITQNQKAGKASNNFLSGILKW